MITNYRQTNTTERRLANPIRVSTANRNAFQRALTRGQERRLAFSQVSGEPTYKIDGTTRHYQVEAWSQPGLDHHVVIYKSSGGAVEVACDCQAAFGGRPCQHAALAIQAAGWWPWPMASQVDAIEELAPAAKPAITTGSIARGHRVQILATGATGVVDRERPPEWLYRFRVIDYDNHEELGWYSAAELTSYIEPDLSA